MKKLFFLLILSQNLFAQDRNFSAFRWDIGLLYARPISLGHGIGTYIEPKYLINDHISVGAKIELDLLGGLKLQNTSNKRGFLTYLNSYTAVADVLVGNSQFRPTFGIGAGLFRLNTLGASQAEIIPELERGGKFGLSPRVGLDVWHFRLAADYNIIFNERNRLTGQSLSFDQNHLTIKVGIFFGGGKKRKEKGETEN